MTTILDYFRWSFRQFYLLLFAPARYRVEVESDLPGQLRLSDRKRDLYLLKILPWTAALASLGNAASGYLWQTQGHFYRWEASWPGVAVGVVFGLLAASVRVGSGVAGSAAGGALVGMIFGGVLGQSGRFPFHPIGAAALGVLFGWLFGLLATLPFRMKTHPVSDPFRTVVLGTLAGMVLSLVITLVSGPRRGLVFGLLFPAALWLVYFRLATYPIEVLLAVIAYGLARWRLCSVARAWRMFPVVWNETQWLPLPGLKKLLVLLAQQDRRAGFEQIMLVAAKPAWLRGSAQSALLEAVFQDLQAQSVGEMAVVADRLAWTETPPIALPIELTAALPAFKRTSAHVGPPPAFGGSEERGDSLGRALKEIDVLQRKLVASQGRLAARLVQRANEWRRLLETERRHLKRENPAPAAMPLGLRTESC